MSSSPPLDVDGVLHGAPLARHKDLLHVLLLLHGAHLLEVQRQVVIEAAGLVDRVS